MPRNGIGTFGVLNPTQIGQLRSSSQVNANFTDMGDEITNSLPIDGQAGMSGAMKAAEGTQVLPGISFSADQNTGFRLTGTDAVAWVAGGQDRVLMDENGKMTFYNGITVTGSVNFSSLSHPQSLFATGESVLTLRRKENDTTERELLTMESGSGAGAKASLRVVGGGSNNVDTMRLYINDVKVLEWTSTSLTHAVDVAYNAFLRASTNGYLDLTEVSAPSSPAVDTARLYCRDASSLTSLYYKNSAGVEIPLTYQSNHQVFTSSGTWSKPNTGSVALIEVWGGGGGTQSGGSGSGGAGGGCYSRKLVPLSSLGSAETVTVGAGGTTSGTAGGTSSFGSHLSAFGGGGATSGLMVRSGAGGGGQLAVGGQGTGSTGSGGSPTGRHGSDTWGGGSGNANPFGGANGNSGVSLFGGGAGGQTSSGTAGGASVFGGGGGAGVGSTAGASIVFGGTGGAASDGVVPGGGAAGSSFTGARGEVRVTVW